MSEQSNIKKGLVLVVYVLDKSDERCNAMSFAKDSKTGRFRCIASYQSGNLDWAKCNIRLLCKSEYEKTFPQGYEIEDAGEVVTLRGELIEFFDKAQELLARKYAELFGEAEVDFQSPTPKQVGDAVKFPLAPLTLDEAIAHCDECADDTPCGKQQKQLSDWLRELRRLREHGNAAKLREAAKSVRDVLGRTCAIEEDVNSIIDDCEFMLDRALDVPPRNCDRFGGDIEKLREACLRERGLNPDEDFPEIFCEWLLAATKKGGASGDAREEE